MQRYHEDQRAWGVIRKDARHVFLVNCTRIADTLKFYNTYDQNDTKQLPWFNRWSRLELPVDNFKLVLAPTKRDRRCAGHVSYRKQQIFYIQGDVWHKCGSQRGIINHGFLGKAKESKSEDRNCRQRSLENNDRPKAIQTSSLQSNRKCSQVHIQWRDQGNCVVRVRQIVHENWWYRDRYKWRGPKQTLQVLRLDI